MVAVTGWRCSELRLHDPPNERRHTGAGCRLPSHAPPPFLSRSPPTRCPCGGRLDVYGDHHSACAQVGVLARRAGPLERAAARICKEAGARVASHVALRDFNVAVPAGDGRRIEVVANGLPIWQGAQIAVDATIVSPVRRDGQPRPRARPTGPRPRPELRQARRCRLVVFGVEVGGRVSRGTLTFLQLLARARKGSPAGAVVGSGRSTGPEPALASPGRVRSAPATRLLAPPAAHRGAQRPI